MTDVAIRACRWCRVRQVVRIATDGRGGIVESPLACGCAERRAAGVCVRCSAETEGSSARCEPCKAFMRLEYSRRWREANPEKRKEQHARRTARERELRDSEAGAEIRARDRAYRKKNRDRINANKKARNLRDAGAKRREHRRARKERNPEAVKAEQDRANAKRAAAKREYMHRYATKYVGEGKAPECRKCGHEVPWDGLGRPRLDCFECRPLDSRERKSPRVVALAERARAEQAA